MRGAKFALVLLNVAVVATAARADSAPETSNSTPGTTIETVVVTAEKRSEDVQKVPLSITAVEGDTLASRHVNSAEELNSIAPGLNVGQFGGIARIAVRGLGFDTINPGTEGRVAYNLDGVYVGNPSAQLGTFFDVDRVEVLRGPQGTLYGRNATGGSINVITNQPTDTLSGYLDVGVGSYNRVNVNAALSGPITDEIDGRIAVSTDEHSGYGKDIFLGTEIDNLNTKAVRGTVRFKPTDNFTWTVSADYFDENDHAADHYFGQSEPGVPLLGVVLGGFTALNVRDISSNVQPENRHEYFGVTSTMVLDLHDVTLKSITAYRGSDYQTLQDLNQTNLALDQFLLSENEHQVSEELQASGNFGGGNSKWIGGFYFYNENVSGGSDIPLSGAYFGVPLAFAVMYPGYQVTGKTTTTAEALYGQIDLALTDQLTATLGGRLGHETVSIHDQSQFDIFGRLYVPGQPLLNLPGFPRAASTSSDSFTPKIGLEYQATPDVLLYATASEGFKSGGFDVGVASPATKPEKLWAYEGGIKAVSLDGRLLTNLSAYYYDYTNLQVQLVNGTNVITTNAAAAELYGAELEFTGLITDQLQVDGSLAYEHSGYLKYSTVDPGAPGLGVQNLAGRQLTQAPEFTANAGLQNHWDVNSGSLVLRAEMNYSSRIFFTPFNNPALSAKPNARFNAFLNYQSGSGHWTGSIYGRNLSNVTVIENALQGSLVAGAASNGVLNAPRTFGFTVGYHF